MNEKRHNELRDYLRWMANEMGLRDWTIQLPYGQHPADPQGAASIEHTYGRKILTVRLCEDFDSFSLERQRHYIVHELVHTHLDRIGYTVNSLKHVTHDPVFTVFESNFNDDIEYITDAIAEIIAPHMPLPKKAKPKKKAKHAPAPKPAKAKEAA